MKAGWGSRPDIYIQKAHESGDDVTSLCFSGDGNTLLSRSTDSTVKVLFHLTRVFEMKNKTYNLISKVNA